VSGTFVLKPFRWPRLWVGLWCLAIVAVVVLSLVNLSGLPPVPEGGDKVEHFIAYALLSASAMQLFATRRGCIAVALLLVAMGIVLEFAQGEFTATRMADAHDALANAMGVLAGFATRFTPLSGVLLAIDNRLRSASR
jgi:VanZ like family.